jgi:hypothetical protein
MKRYALVSLTNITRSEIEAHVPDHYDVLAVLSDLPNPCPAHPVLVLHGRDRPGSTLHQHVLPALAAAGITASEIDLSHAVMKHIPA